MADAADPQATAAGENALAFGPFRLLSARRLLLEGDKPVRLGSRAFDLLAALVERAGEVVPKEELIARAWPQTFVEESNLKIQVSALRRALGDGQGGHRFVVTVPGRGYNFVAPVSPEEPSRAAPPPTAAPTERPHNLPLAATRMIGREDAVAAIVSRLSRQRLVTIVGPGGIGKTTLALAVAERMTADYQHGVWLIDLAPPGDPRLVPSAVAGALGLEIHAENLLPGLVANLSDKRMLLLLDTCEHVIDAAARLAAAILRGAPGVGILATSREPLAVAGEHEYRLGPLAAPLAMSRRSAAEAAAFPAVQLFVERVSAVVEDFALSDANAPLIGEICRRLDGLPLAIEFAAPRVEALGVEGLAAHLDDSLPVLGARRRSSAMPRHRTMRAVLDWSYGLLSEDEQRFFRALGIFTGGFTVEAAAAVAIGAAETAFEAIDRLSDLVAKSLVVADVSGARPRFRLLDTTRAYAIEKLDASGERERRARRHAEYYRNLFERAEGVAATRPRAEWLADYAREIDNLRGALDWAFSPGGNTAIGVALTVASGLLWTRLSLSDECRRLTKRALAALGPGSDLATRRQIQLLALLGWSLQQTSGATSETRAAFSKILELSQSMHDIKFKSLAMWGLWIYHFNNGEFATALDLAKQSIAEEGVDAIHSLAGERIIGLSLHYLGEQSSSRRQIESVLRHPVDPLHQPDDLSFAIDHRVTLRAFLARILWLQGFPDQAMRMAKENVEDALALDHALSLANALVQAACPVAFFIGDLVAAEHFVGMLLDHSTRHALGPWQAWGRCFEGMLLIKRGDTVTGLQRLRTAISGLRDIGYAVYYVAFTGELAEALGRAGQAAHGLATIDEALARSELSEERWCVAELLRIKGELVVLQGISGAERAAEEHFRQALDWARRQGALSWELRAATSLARLLRSQDCTPDAIACLQPVLNRFTEGFGTADLVAAKQLLNELSQGHQQRSTLDL